MTQPTTRTTSTLTALLLVVPGAVGLAAGAAPVSAAPAGGDCVTRAEVREVSRGDTRRQVHRTFGTSGSFGDGGAGGFTRTYAQCRATNPEGETCRVVVEYAAEPGERPRVRAKRFNGSCA